MKKSIQAKIYTLAAQIKEQENNFNTQQIKAFVAELYEDLSVLDYLEKQALVEASVLETTRKEKAAASAVEAERADADAGDDQYAPDGTTFNPAGITEPNTEKIKDNVAEMPPESAAVDEGLEGLTEAETPVENFRDYGVNYDDLPTFEPKSEPVEKSVDKRTVTETDKSADQEVSQKTHEEAKSAPVREKEISLHKSVASPARASLNDRLKKGISFGINDRHMYVKHLFNDEKADYDRVISQLNTCRTWEEAALFITEMVQPDYPVWEEKKIHVQRFMAAIKSKY